MTKSLLNFKGEQLMNTELDFENLVEVLEDQEDMVECKECFDLFPKAECAKQEIGYLCPTCGKMSRAQTMVSPAEYSVFDTYDQEFPDIQEYDPGTTKDYNAEPKIEDALADLIKDEYEAIDGYEVADETIQHASIPEDEKDDILDTLEHIKEEEEEHIDELKELTGEEDPEDESDDEDKESEEKTELNEELLEQKLDEEALNEIWPFNGAKKARDEVDSVFVNGYVIYALPSKIKHEAATIEDAVKACKAVSKKAPKDKVLILPKAIPDEQLKGYDPELQKLIDQKNGFAAAIVVMQNGDLVEDKIKSFAKFKKNIDKQNEIINKVTSNGRSGTDARAGLAADEAPAETTEPAETADVDLEDPIEEAREKALEILGAKESADKYTEESYAKYSAKYDDYLAKIKAAKKLETLTDRYIPQLPGLVEKIKALLEEKPADAELETAAADATDDKADEVDGTAGDSSAAPTAEPEETTAAKAKKKRENGEIRRALRAAGMSDADIQKLFDKGAIRAIRKTFGEGLSLTAGKLKSILTESTATPIREEYHKYANPAELQAMEDLEAIIDAAKNDALHSMQNWGIDISESDSQGWMSGNSEYTYQFMLDYEGIDEDEEEDIQDQLQNMVESAILSKYTLPPELSKISVSVMLPDLDIAYDDNDDEILQDTKRASLLVDVTFARKLI
jgi:rubrerythrin